MKKLNEQKIIDILSDKIILPKNICGIGDDAAVLEQQDHCEVITKDLLIEDQHFRLSYYTPAQLAKKALHVNLSDIAAMGATARYVFLGLSIPINTKTNWLEAFLQSFKEECQQANVYLLGGDTTLSPHGFMISLTVIGDADKTHIKYRNGASPSDAICLLDYAGDAHAGLLLLEHNMADFMPLKESALAPTALSEEGMWLGSQTAVTAMLDTSDGIYIDLKRLCAASNVGAVLNVEQLPISPLLPAAAQQLSITPTDCALIGGEDYGLLFTVKKEAVSNLQHAFQQDFAIPLTTIGTITETKTVELRQNNMEYRLHSKPFSHFNEDV